MALIQNLLNVGVCGASNFAGTSTDYCKLDIKRLRKILRFPYNYKFPADFEFTEDNVNLLIQSGKCVPIYNLEGATFNTDANGIETLAGGRKVQLDKMPYSIEAKMLNGIQGYQAMLSIEKATAHSFVLIDDAGNWFLSETTDGQAKAINSNFFNVEPYNMQGDASAGYMIMLQLDRRVFDNELKGIFAENIPFSSDDIQGVEDVELTITSATDTTVVFTAKRKNDQASVTQYGLATANVQVTVEGVVVAGTLANVGEVYTFTRTSGTTVADDVINLRLFDGTYAIIEMADGKLLKSNTATWIML